MTLETKTLQSPLGPPPSVVLMPKHISHQFEAQQQQQQPYSQVSIVDQVLQKRSQNRRLKLQHEMGMAMNHLKNKQIHFKKYIDKRTTPPKIKHTTLQENNTKKMDPTSFPGNNGITYHHMHPTKVMAEKKRQYHRRKIQKRKRRRERRRKKYLKWKRDQKRKKRRKEEKKRRKMRKKRKKQDLSCFENLKNVNSIVF